MVARCIKCNRRTDYRPTRGFKLIEHFCKCGGSLERIGGNKMCYGENPVWPEKTHEDEDGRKFFSVESNSRGDLFVIKYGEPLCHPITGFERKLTWHEKQLLQ